MMELDSLVLDFHSISLEIDKIDVEKTQQDLDPQMRCKGDRNEKMGRRSQERRRVEEWRKHQADLEVVILDWGDITTY